METMWIGIRAAVGDMSSVEHRSGDRTTRKAAQSRVLELSVSSYAVVEVVGVISLVVVLFVGGE